MAVILHQLYSRSRKYLKVLYNSSPLTCSAVMPPKKVDLRACLICSVIQPFSDFVAVGCPNCEEILEVSRLQPHIASPSDEETESDAKTLRCGVNLNE